jgi:hypothetical protein
MFKRDDELNPWTKEDEMEHFPSVMEWWAAEAFFQTLEDKKKWSLKVAFTEWFEQPEKIGFISNMTLFNHNAGTYTVHYIRDDTKKLDSETDRFFIRQNDSFMKGAFPKYTMRFVDTRRDIVINFSYRSDSFPHWISQEVTNGWLPMGLGFYRYGFIPKNSLSGAMKIKEKTFTIKGIGYFEHVWGDFDYDKPLAN